jgi:hypothetical protein
MGDAEPIYVVLVKGAITMGEGGPNGSPPKTQAWKAIILGTDLRTHMEWAGPRSPDWFDKLSDQP